MNEQRNNGVFLTIAGLVAAGFDKSGKYLLTVSHSGRGLYCTKSWQRLARDYNLAYPCEGKVLGIGPIEGESTAVTELDYDKGRFQVSSQDGRLQLHCESDGIRVTHFAT